MGLESEKTWPYRPALAHRAGVESTPTPLRVPSGGQDLLVGPIGSMGLESEKTWPYRPALAHRAGVFSQPTPLRVPAGRQDLQGGTYSPYAFANNSTGCSDSLAAPWAN
jgi:hypothetical protein